MAADPRQGRGVWCRRACLVLAWSGTVGLGGATARPRCSIHAPGLDAVDGHFWQFQLFNVLGIALVVVSLVPLVRRKGGAMAETDLIQRVAQKLLFGVKV
jgi:hypothetical protein